MRALVYESYGSPAEVLHVGEAPEPHAGPGQVRIRVRAAGINPVDWKLMGGAMAGGAPLTDPVVPGFDAAGVVDEVGEGVTGVTVGDDVLGLGSGAQAELSVLWAWAPKPAEVDWSVAAAAPTAVETTERALRLVGVEPGQTVFVDGGAGGVGAVAVQMAVAQGLTVVASASEANQGYLRELGATPVVYGDGLVERVRAAAPGGVDVVYDVAGKTPVEDLLALAPSPGKVVSIANFTLPEHGGISTGGGQPGERRGPESMAVAADLLRRSAVVIKVQTFPYERAAEAYATSTSGHVRGKLVLLP